MISSDNCLLVMVANHKQDYNGTICPDPLKHNCGSSQSFRRNNCVKKHLNCHDINLFNQEKPYFRKNAYDVDQDGYFTELSEVLAEGKKPIIFFYTNSGQRKVLVGLYVVELVEKTGYEFHVHAANGYAVLFPNPRMENTKLWKHSDMASGWCSLINASYVATALEEIIKHYEDASRRSVMEKKLHEKHQKVIFQLQDILFQMGHLYDSSENEGSESGAQGDISFALPEGQAQANLNQVKPVESATWYKDLDKELTFEVNQQYREAILNVIERVQQQARSLGLYYPDDLIRRFHISFQTKPFVILAGISGGGKTQFVINYAEAIEAELLPVSVRPDWTNNESLLGNYNMLTERFVPTPFAEFLYKANTEYDKALSEKREPRKYVVLLDEMNLSRVEYYFSDFLSKMELPPKYRFVQFYEDSLKCDNQFPNKLSIPPNFYICGTVNIDETTHTFSNKVLDRSNFIKFDDIDLKSMSKLIDNWKPEVINKSAAQLAIKHLSKLNNILRGARQNFGYRTAREIIYWVDYALCSGAFAVHSALDLQLQQKVLVKLQISRSNDYDIGMLEQLRNYFEDEKLVSGEHAFPGSIKYIEDLLSRVKEDEFAIGQY